MRRNKVDVITLGCSKNLVDSEHLLRQLQAAGYLTAHDPDAVNGETVIVNTCGFIADAQEESINTILQLGEAKRRGKIRRLVVMGCLAERFRAELTEQLPEVDRFFGKFDWHGVLDYLGKPYRSELAAERVLTTPSHYAYLKISEGCDRFCAFCAIPLITGRHTSVPRTTLVDEVKYLRDRGVRELNVIAQDLSSYGLDLDGTQQLARLVDDIAAVDGIDWIRLHYAYPTQFPLDVLDVMAARDNVCAYMDIALQHISDKVLDAMRRHITREQTERLIETMRARVPELHLRTTLMVGFPGEGEREFVELLDWVKQVRLERMGAFAYSEEAGTYAARHLRDDVPAAEKQRRLDALMSLQEEISLEIQQAKVGRTLRVMVDRDEGECYVGRTQWDSPEVDPEVIIAKRDGVTLRPGDFTEVIVTGAAPFELLA